MDNANTLGGQSHPRNYPTQSSSSSSCSQSDEGNEAKNNRYRAKCIFLQHHLREAMLVNKALKSELSQYKEKIEFERKIQKFLRDRLKRLDSLDT